MAADQNKNRSLHIVMFPWLAFGHIIPFLELAKFIAKKGHRVTLVSTPRTITRLPKPPPAITFLGLKLPKVDGLPEHVEVTADLSGHDDSLLKKACDGLQPELTRFLKDSVPDWIIYDFCSHWLPPVAAELGIPKCYFSIFTASSHVFFGSLEMLVNGSDPRKKVEDFTVPPPWVPFESKLAFKLHEGKWAFNAGKTNESGVSDTLRVAYTIMGSDSVMVRQCNEFEGKWVSLLEEMNKIPIIPVGLMPPRVEETELSSSWVQVEETELSSSWVQVEETELSSSWVQVKEWLDHQDRGSVLYVAFGSEVAMSQVQLSELALGLEASRIPFFWALRKLSESTELPDGFEERVKGRGIVWKSWVPQVNILSHNSVGGFLTHCGWSSVIEGLMFGHPLVMLPFVIDTGLVARILGEKMVGMEVPRNEEDGSYSRDSIADSVRLVMVEEEGKFYRKNSMEVVKIFGNRELQDGYLHNVVTHLEDNTKKSSVLV